MEILFIAEQEGRIKRLERIARPKGTPKLKGWGGGWAFGFNNNLSDNKRIIKNYYICKMNKEIVEQIIALLKGKTVKEAKEILLSSQEEIKNRAVIPSV